MSLNYDSLLDDTPPKKTTKSQAPARKTAGNPLDEIDNDSIATEKPSKMSQNASDRYQKVRHSPTSAVQPD